MQPHSELTHIAAAMRANVLHTILMIISVLVESGNHYSMFRDFSLKLHPDNELMQAGTAVMFSAFMVSAIVGFGLRKQRAASWIAAVLSVGVNLAVYQKLGLDWTQPASSHLAMLILAVFSPIVAAYTTDLLAAHIPANRQNRDADRLRQKLMAERELREVAAQFGLDKQDVQALLLASSPAPVSPPLSPPGTVPKPKPKAEPEPDPDGWLAPGNFSDGGLRYEDLIGEPEERPPLNLNGSAVK